MKRLSIVLIVLLLIWNVWLTYSLFSAPPENKNDDTVVIHTINGYTTDITEIVEKAKPAITAVTSRSNENVKNYSGIIYEHDDEHCYIITTAELIQEDAEYEVRFDNGIIVSAELVGCDEVGDIMLLDTHPDFEADVIPLANAEQVKDGEYAVGMGARRFDSQSNLISFGVVTKPFPVYRSYNGTAGYIDCMSTDMNLSRYMSGGPVLNISGELLGIISNVLGSSIPGASNGILSVTDIRHIVDQLKTESVVNRGYLGIMTKNIHELELYQRVSMNIPLDITEGIVVTSVDEGSPAAAAGIQVNDVILKMNDLSIENKEMLNDFLYSLKTDEQVIILVQRENITMNCAVVVK